jgi:hypothetical protein
MCSSNNAPLKKEVISALQNFSDCVTVSTTNTFAEKYVHSLRLLFKAHHFEISEKFFHSYSILLESKKFPLLKVNSVITLYQRFKNYPPIFSDLQLLSKLIHVSNSSEKLWEAVILNIGKNSGDRNLQSARIHLLSLCVNRKVLTEKYLEHYSFVVNLILDTCLKESQIKSLKKGLKKEDDHHLNFLMHRLDQMIQKGKSGLEISNVYTRHFTLPDENIRFDELFKKFIFTMDEKFNDAYLIALKKYELLKFYHVFKLRPALFDDLQEIDLAEGKSLKLFKALFKNFHLSETMIVRFFSNELEETEWFDHMLKGNNLITAKGMFFTLTKKGAHAFRELPYDKHLEVKDALIYCELVSKIGDPIYAMRAMRCFHDRTKTDFWIKALCQLFEKGVYIRDIREVADYIQDKVFHRQETLDLKHIKLENLMRNVHIWHHELNFKKIFGTGIKERFPKRNIPVFETEFDNKKYVIRQILKPIELYAEGETLHHCVFTYRRSCAKGQTSIFSLKIKDHENKELPLITIEVVQDSIVQAKGNYNRSPNAVEEHLIDLWADENELYNETKGEYNEAV